ncbi:MAG: type II toxin-antitoxin system Phd/YefM family antitoxin [Terracidiphilus sp.]
MRTVPAGEFKAKCLAILDQVNETGEAVLVTKRGKPVAKVVAFEETEPRKIDVDSIFGALRGMPTINGDIVSSEHTDDEWDRLFDERWKRVLGEERR